MKKLILSFLLTFILNQMVSYAEPKHFTSQVSEVTVYLQGASVKRTAHINLQQGSNEIILDGLSNYLDINSVRLESNSNLTILSVNAATNYLNPAQKSSEETAVLTILDTMNRRLSLVQNEIAALNTELEMMKANYRVTTGNQGFYVDALENTADFFDKRIKDILNGLIPLHAREKELTDKITPLNQQLNEIHRKNGTPQGEITVVATSPGYVEADISFSYYVSQASWIPAYSMRAANDSSNILLDYDAEVTQSSGEDWNNVKLTLSTGNPSVSGVKPKLIVNRLDYENQQVVVNKKMMNNSFYSNNAPSGDVNNAIAQPLPSGGINYASDYTNMNQNILATVFDINLKYNILSDGIAKHVRIQQDKDTNKFNLRVKSYYGDDEKALLTDFKNLLDKSYNNTGKHMLCAHNGIEFDFPYIARRMLINEVALPTLLDVSGTKSWDNKWLIDTMDLWRFGDYKEKTSLNLLAACFNIPSPKDDISGKDVARVYHQEKDLERIMIYCQKDIVTLFRLFQRFSSVPMIPDEEVVYT